MAHNSLSRVRSLLLRKIRIMVSNNVLGVEYSYSIANETLVSEAQCKLDAALMQKLGANSVKFWNVDSSNHSGCMFAYDQAGIYVWAGLSGLGAHLNPVS
jgi:1,3-beta-glucanosyltransferase GAS1